MEASSSIFVFLELAHIGATNVENTYIIDGRKEATMYCIVLYICMHNFLNKIKDGYFGGEHLDSAFPD